LAESGVVAHPIETPFSAREQNGSIPGDGAMRVRAEHFSPCRPFPSIFLTIPVGQALSPAIPSTSVSPDPLLFLILHLCVRRGVIARVSQHGLESEAVALSGDGPESTIA